MATYFITATGKPESRPEVAKRYATPAARMPEGVTELGRWHRVTQDGAYFLVETDDPNRLVEFFDRWADVLSFSMEAVFADKDVADFTPSSE